MKDVRRKTKDEGWATCEMTSGGCFTCKRVTPMSRAFSICVARYAASPAVLVWGGPSTTTVNTTWYEWMVPGEDALHFSMRSQPGVRYKPYFEIGPDEMYSVYAAFSA